MAGKYGVVYKGFYTDKENKTIEVAIKTVKGILVYYHKSLYVHIDLFCFCL